MSKKGTGIIITRTDKIGDLVLSLPVIKTISKMFPNHPLFLMVSSYAAPVVENYPGVTDIIYYDSQTDNLAVDRSKQIIQQIENLNCSVALMLVYDSAVLNILKKAGIKERYGPLTKISGVFSYTKFLSQHRSKVEKHELEYNLALLKLLGIKECDYDHTLDLPVASVTVNRVFEKLKNMGFKDPSSGYIIMHPTMGGSALNWRYSYYAELASLIIKETGVPIIVTGSKNDAKISKSITQHINGACYDVSGVFSLKELIALISRAKLFIGPSTGPMHIAVATSVPVVALFSPVQVQSPKRWGPYSKYAVSIVPELECSGRLACLYDKCLFYNCMDTISVENVFEKVKRMYESSESQMDLLL